MTLSPHFLIAYEGFLQGLLDLFGAGGLSGFWGEVSEVHFLNHNNNNLEGHNSLVTTVQNRLYFILIDSWILVQDFRGWIHHKNYQLFPIKNSLIK